MIINLDAHGTSAVWIELGILNFTRSLVWGLCSGASERDGHVEDWHQAHALAQGDFQLELAHMWSWRILFSVVADRDRAKWCSRISRSRVGRRTLTITSINVRPLVLCAQ